MAAINFPDAPTNGQIFESGGMSWTYVAGIGWTLNSAIVEAGSGFTFIADTMPLPVNVGDTWFDSSTGASGGTSWVAVEEGPAGASEKVWVQFSPGIGASPGPTPQWRMLSFGALSVPVNAITYLGFNTVPGQQIGNIGNRASGYFYLGEKGIYMVHAIINWSTSWGAGAGASGMVMDLDYTDNQGATNFTLGSQLCGPTPWGTTHNVFFIDCTVGSTTREYNLRVYNYIGTMSTTSIQVDIAKVSERI